MSYQKLKDIKIDRYNMRVVFMEKSNNDTSPYRHGDCSVPFFVHSCWGGVYQHSNKRINSIIKDMEHKFNALVVSSDDLWWTFEKSIANDTMQEIREDLRDIFYNTCDKINGLS